ncbi:MAG: IPT/TIG domain-containing protein, partial [Planctomycetes bacterium]|nr:IPT/TIG domain-containing protein [Planctomycetota bacterium]
TYNYEVVTVTNTSATPIQLQVIFFNTSANSIHVSVHSGTYDPMNQGTGYLGDSGSSSSNSGFRGLSCTVPASTNYELVFFTASPAAFGDYDATVFETAPNSAPVLDNSGTPALTAIAQDLPGGSNTGDTIGALIATGAAGDPITDPDSGAVEGLGVTSVDTTNGTWEFTIDGGANWNTITLSGTDALLLADNANTSIRFVPNASFTGTQTAGITFRAWDQTQGLNGELMPLYDIGNGGNQGNASALSDATEDADITVNAQATVTVTAIAPSSGDIGGGQTVTITGTEFGASSTVTIGGTAATGVVVNSATSITCVTPAGSLGMASVIVTSNGSSNAANTLYTYVTGVPEIAVLRDGTTNITDGGTESQNSTGTAAFPANYTIQNTGTAVLNLTGVSGMEVVISGETNCSVIVTQPTTVAIGASSSTTFNLQVTPTAAGTFSFSVSIANDDSDENPFNWTFNGNTAGGSGGGGGGGGDDGGCSTGGTGHYSWMVLLGLLSAFVVFTRVRGSKA